MNSSEIDGIKSLRENNNQYLIVLRIEKEYEEEILFTKNIKEYLIFCFIPIEKLSKWNYINNKSVLPNQVVSQKNKTQEISVLNIKFLIENEIIRHPFSAYFSVPREILKEK